MTAWTADRERRAIVQHVARCVFCRALLAHSRRRGDRLTRTGQPDEKACAPARLGMLHHIELSLGFAHQLARDV